MSRPDRAATVVEAISVIGPGTSIGVGGMTLFRRPVALLLALSAETRATDLTLAGNTLSIETEFLIALGRVKCLRTTMVTLEVFGLAPVFRGAVEGGRLVLIEETEATLSLSLLAARAGLPFVAWQGLSQSDLLSLRPDIHITETEGKFGRLLEIPAWRPDVTLIHAVEVDERGNAFLGAEVCMDVELAESSATTIVSAERIVPQGELAGPTDLWGSTVDIIVESPRGAFPTSTFPEYPVAGEFLLDWVEQADARHALLREVMELHGIPSGPRTP